MVKLEWFDDMRLFCLSTLRLIDLNASNERMSTPIAIADKDALKPQLVPAIIALSGASDKAIRAQIAQSVSLMAKPDFSERLPELIEVRQWNERT